MDDVKSATAVSDTNGLKSIALDHLGTIAARLKLTQLRVAKFEATDSPKLKSLDAVCVIHCHLPPLVPLILFLDRQRV